MRAVDIFVEALDVYRERYKDLITVSLVIIATLVVGVILAFATLPTIVVPFLVAIGAYIVLIMSEMAGYIIATKKNTFQEAFSEASNYVVPRIVADLLIFLINIAVLLIAIAAPYAQLSEAMMSGNMSTEQLWYYMTQLFVVIPLLLIVALLFFPYKYLVIKYGNGIRAVIESPRVTLKNLVDIVLAGILIILLSVVVASIPYIGTILHLFIVVPVLLAYYALLIDKIAE